MNFWSKRRAGLREETDILTQLPEAQSISIQLLVLPKRLAFPQKQNISKSGIHEMAAFFWFRCFIGGPPAHGLGISQGRLWVGFMGCSPILRWPARCSGPAWGT